MFKIFGPELSDSFKKWVYPRYFNGKVFLGFTLMLFLFCASAGFSLYYTQKNITDRHDRMVKDILPMRYYCSIIDNSISRTTSALDNYLTTDANFYSTERKNIWRVSYTQAIDSLMNYARLWDNEKAAGLVYDIRIKAGRLESEQNYIEEQHYDRIILGNSDSEKQKRRDQINSLHLLGDDIHSVIELLINLQQEEVRSLRAEIAHHDYSLYSIIIPSSFVEMLILVGFLIINFRRTLRARITHLENVLSDLESGALPEGFEKKDDEFQPSLLLIKSITEKLRSLNAFARKVGEGDFDAETDSFDRESQVGASMLSMRDSLRELKKHDRKVSWSVKGVAEFSDMLRDNKLSVKEHTDTFASKLIHYIGVEQCAIYLTDDENKRLELNAWYAYDVKKYRQKSIEIGEGLAGEAFRERRTVYLENLPKDYAYINSGLGKTEPGSLLIVPIRAGETLEGVIEIASLKPIEEYKREFTEKIAESLASALNAIRSNGKTMKLLREAQEQSEMMRSQEEEMRQNMEELQATQEEMSRKEQEINQLLKRYQARESVLEKSMGKMKQMKENLKEKDKEIEDQKRVESDLLLKIERLERKIKRLES